MTVREGYEPIVELLEKSRAAEKEQALAYRSLAARAEHDSPENAQRFHDLHADEQHHLSRLTARVLELGARPQDLSGTKPPALPLEGWEAEVRDRELAEIERYRGALEADLDDHTRELLEEILSVEEQHARELGGKWTLA